MLKNNRHTLPSDKGFTLIEIAAFIMISGVVMLAAAEFVKLYTINQKRTITLENAKYTQDALFEFYALEGRYPCPADPTLPIGHNDYGREQCRAFNNPALDKDHCVNVPANIACYDENTGAFSRDGDENGTIDVVTEGIVPFQTLIDTIVQAKYSAFHKKDGYGQLYSYAVTEHMTDFSRFETVRPANPRTGAIRVLDENRIDMPDPADSAHYVVFSHGNNGKGGFSPNGQQIDNCFVSILPPPAPPSLPAPGASGAGIDLEIENCDRNDPIYIKGIYSTAQGDTFFDDHLVFQATGNVPIWKASLAAGTETWLYNTNLDNIGIGTDAPEEKLHIFGNLKAGASIMAQDYCSKNGSNCLNPSALGGDIADMRCPNNQVAYAVGDNKLECRNIDWTATRGRSCPVGQYINGFSNLGRIRCCDGDGSNCQTL